MSWFPNFLSPLTGIIAAAIAVPALLVLYFLKLRRRELPISSTLLWKKAIQDLQVNAPFQKLRRNLLLILQMAALLFLCLALTRPVTFFKPGAGKNTVILIDRSASMNATDMDNGKTSRLDEAKRRAKDLVGTMERGASAMVIAFDETAETVQPFTTDTALLKTAIDSIKPTDRKSRLKLAYQLADANMGYNPDQLRANTVAPDVEVYSDGRVLDSTELSIKSKPKFNQIGTDTAGNVAVVALSAKRNYERPTEVQVFARLASFGPKPVSADVELGVAPIDPGDPSSGETFAVRGVATVNLPPARWSDEDWLEKHKAEKDENFVGRDSVEFTLDLTTAATIRIEHKAKEGDMLAADDVAYVSLPPPKALGVLLVTDGNWFMEKLLHSLSLKNPQVMSPAEYEKKLPANFDVILFDRAYIPQKLPPAGNFIYFGSIAPGLKLKQDTTPDGKQLVLSESGVLDWKRDHPILKNLSLSKLWVGEGIKLQPPPESEVLVEGTKGPLVVLHREARSTHLVVAFDLMQSNWPTHVSFPVFMYQSLQYMAVGTDLSVVQSYDPGATPRIPRTNLVQVSEDLKSVRLNGPGGSRNLTVPATGDFTLPALDKVGVYRTEPAIPQYERIVVNLLDENESNLVPADHAPGGIGETIEGGSGRARLDLWWWLVACAALPIMMIEWWVYTRRVHL
jgi:hypothetical protein